MKWEEESASGIRKWFPFTLIAVVLHFGLIWSIQDLDWLTPPNSSESTSIKRVKLRDFAKPKERPQAKVRKDLQKKPEETLQVVNLPPDHRAEAPKDAKFSATTDHSVDKETISRFQTPGYENAGHELTKATPSPSTETSSPQPEPEPHEEDTVDESSDSNSASKPAVATKEPVADEGKADAPVKIDLGPPLKSLGNFSPKRASLRKAERTESEGHGQDRERAIDRLIPDFRVLADLNSSPANDVMDEDIELGDGTYLNTKSFKYASFFNRFHRSVSRHWNPIIEYRRRDPTGHVYGPRSRHTVLEVELDANGALVSSRVVRSSGLDFLDREAIASLKRAQPFPNPPEGLLDDDRIFFNFGFQLTHGRR